MVDQHKTWGDLGIGALRAKGQGGLTVVTARILRGYHSELPKVKCGGVARKDV